MKEELQSKLVEILTSIQAAAGKTADFAMEQLPDIAQSYIAYGRASSTVLFALSLIAVAACISGWRYVVRHEDAGSMPPLFLGSILAVGAAVITGNSALIAWVAPKVWLLKELAALAK